MELNIKFDEKMLVETANCVLDEYEYNGKTIREWADLIANPKTNADSIRSMTDEELANMFWSYVDCGECPKHRECKMTGQDCLRLAFEWLREEAANENI